MRKFIRKSKLLTVLMFVSSLTSVTMMTLADEKSDSSQKEGSGHIGHFRHVVFFTFKEGTPSSKVDEIVAAFGALKSQIPSIIDYEWGPSQSVEKLNDGFTHCFLVTFKDKAGLEAYLPSAPHKAFGKLLRPHLGKVFVFDFTAEK